MIDEFECYVPDVFAELNDIDDIPKKHRVKKLTSTEPFKVRKKSKKELKEKKLPKAVVEMQKAYEELIALDMQDLATSNDWQNFYNSIIKFVMKHAYVTNFKHYVEKDSDLWCHLIYTIFERIKPKRKPDGTKSCWYIDKNNMKVKTGYDPAKCSNIGNYLLSTIKWTIVNFNYIETFNKQQLSGDEDISSSLDNEIIYATDTETYYAELADKLNVIGDIQSFRREVNAIWKLRNIL